MALTILPGPLLRERTTLRLGGPAMAEVVVRDADDCAALPAALARLGGRPLVLGRGSNILASDDALSVVVVTPAVGETPTVLGDVRDERGQGVLVRVGAAFRLPRLLVWASTQGLAGLEGLAGIPGTVGGAVAMNAGSYGCETGACVERVEVVDSVHGPRVLGREQLEFAYRHFSVRGEDVLPTWHIVTAVVFRFRQTESAIIRHTMREVHIKKKSTQPIAAHSAGCIFKNPTQKESAGKLLDDAGMKGMRYGDMAFSELHANFLINLGNGTSREADYLIKIAQERICKINSISLVLEVKVVV